MYGTALEKNEHRPSWSSIQQNVSKTLLYHHPLQGGAPSMYFQKVHSGRTWRQGALFEEEFWDQVT